MRNKIVLTLIIILALALTGCGRAGTAAKAKPNDAGTQQQAVTGVGQETSNPAVPPTDSSGTNQAASGVTATPASNSAASTQAAGSSAIVAKSGNIISSSDKEALLNEIDKELDALLTGVNSLDEVQDTDLDLN